MQSTAKPEPVISVPFDRRREVLIQGSPIGQLGQNIVGGQIADPLLGAIALGNVERHANVG